MADYKVPLRNIRFLINEVFDYPASYKLLGAEDADPETIDAILDECARFSEEVLAPLNRPGDEEGCHFSEGQVKTPKGFKEAYRTFVDGGWSGLSADRAYGGQGLPESTSVLMTEMLGASNTAWAMYPGLSHGAMAAIYTHGTEEQKKIYLTRLIEGRWTGTMCLTEAHCGSDLGLIKTRATPQSDGSYKISGTKIFISAGEHDMSQNIVHLVLAKLPDAPLGTKGISLFIVPKFLPGADGEASERNLVTCGAIEHKMGIKAAATCVMNFDDAKGYLVGLPNKGLNCMFTFMNNARLVTGIQGLCLGEVSFQHSLSYANDRLQMRSLTGAKEPSKVADPIIVHPDVRRMLLTMKAINEGNRALAYFTAQQLDIAHLEKNGELQKDAENLLAFITPICKAFISETSQEVTNYGMQILGGHGYIRESGLEQLVRDCRIATIYEGTTGIQALDLLGRKVLGSQGKLLQTFSTRIEKMIETHTNHPKFKDQITELDRLNKEWTILTQKIGMAALKNLDEVGAASVDYLMYSGYIALAYFWLRMALAAHEKLEAGTSEVDFYQSKLLTCDFYFKRILPRTSTHMSAALSGSHYLMFPTVAQIRL